jgi:hypothetical protein
MLGESKFDVLKLVPDQYKPNTILIKTPATVNQVLKALREQGFQFPVIFKPDFGERGFMVKRIDSESEIGGYLSKSKGNFLIQELVDLPVECGVFYVRLPNEENGKVTSLVLKEMLTVKGDGNRTLEELILSAPRAKLQWETLKQTHSKRLPQIIPVNEEVILNSIGNHCLGTKFLDGEALINDRLTRTFDHISKQVAGFYFGRYDLRCASIEDLYEGRVKVMELNGCGAEPAHIYQPGYSLWKALYVLYWHWKSMFIISMQNHKKGTPFISFSEGKKVYRNFKATVQ